MTPGADGPDPRYSREWLSWVSEERRERLIGYVRTRTPVTDLASAEDVVQDGILKILAEQFEPPAGRREAWLWLLRVLRNVARNRARTEAIRDNEPLDEARTSREPVRDGREGGWAIAEHLERSEALGEALECLTSAEREVIELRYVEGLTVRETAAFRGCARGTVKKHTTAARAKLRAELNGQFGPE